MKLYRIADWFIDLFKYLKAKSDYISLPFVILMTALPMFFRGMYFEVDRAAFGIYACIVLAGIFLFNKKCAGINAEIDTGIIALTVMSGITTAFAVNKDSAILTFASYLLLLLVYMATKSASGKEDRVRAFITAVCWAIGLMSLISLLTAAGVFNYPVAYSPAEGEKWLNGTVQYHNAFGALTVAGFFGLCGVYSKTVKKPLYWINLLGYYLLMFGIIMSYSRGAWLIAPVGFIIYMIMADKDARLKVVSYLASTAISVLAVLTPFSQAVEMQNKVMGCVWLAVGLVITLILSVMLDVVVNQIKTYKHFNKIVIAISVILIAVIAVVVLFPQIFSFVLPQSMVIRLQGLNFGTKTVTERFVFYGDALKMVKKSPIIGLGGGAWADMYGMYQSYDYSSNQIHSYFFQVLTEMGVIGVVALLWIVVFLVVAAVRIRKSQKISNGTASALLSVCGVLLLHSMIDFDLSIFGVSVVLWAFLAMISASAEMKNANVHRYIWAFTGIILLVFMVTDYVGIKARDTGDAIFTENISLEQEGYEINNERYIPAFQAYEKAVQFKPYDAKALASKAAARMCVSSAKPEERALSVEEFEKAERIAPYSMGIQESGIEMYRRIGALQYAVTCLKNQVVLFPKYVDNYLVYIQTAYDVMNYYRYDGVLNVAGEISKEALEIKDFAEEKGTVLPDATKGYFDMFEVVYNNTLRGTEKE